MAWNEAIIVFLNFFAFFLDFSITRWVRTKRNETVILIFTMSQTFPSYFGLKWCYNGIFLIFLIFLLFFLEFSITRWVGTERNESFSFLSLSGYSNLFWLEMKPQSYFFNFLNFSIFFFRIFYYASGTNETER